MCSSEEEEFTFLEKTRCVTAIAGTFQILGCCYSTSISSLSSNSSESATLLIAKDLGASHSRSLCQQIGCSAYQAAGSAVARVSGNSCSLPTTLLAWRKPTAHLLRHFLLHIQIAGKCCLSLQLASE